MEQQNKEKMNTIELTAAATSHPVLRHHFGGVFASDQLPAKSARNRYYIVNLDPSHKAGSHWVVCFMSDDGNIYFDSYGFPPLVAPIKHFMEKRGDFKFNDRLLQCPQSTACGQWCLFFICWKLWGLKLATLYKRFENQDLLRNDHEINHWLKLALNVDEKVVDSQFMIRQIAVSLKENVLW